MTEIISLVNNCVSEYFSAYKSCLYRRVKNANESNVKGFCWLILHDIYNISHNKLSKEYKTDVRYVKRKISNYRDYIKIYPEYNKILDEIKLLLDSSPN